MNIIEMLKVDTEVLSIERYMDMTEADRHNVKSVRIIPPSFDGDDFGAVSVQYKTPTYQMDELHL